MEREPRHHGNPHIKKIWNRKDSGFNFQFFRQEAVPYLGLIPLNFLKAHGNISKLGLDNQ